MRTAAGTLHAHLREAAAQIPAERGAAAARAALAAMGARLADRTLTDIAGSHVGLLAVLGIHVDPRTAREAVRLLSRVSSLIEYQPGGARGVQPSRIRLASAYRWSVARAERGRIDTSIFAPAAVAQPCLDGLFLAIWHHTDPETTVSDSGSPIDARAQGDSCSRTTTSEFLRATRGHRWIELAARLLVDHAEQVPGDVALVTTAHARALFVAAGRSHGYREVGCLLRGLRWLARRGWLRADVSGLWDAMWARHPDSVILGIVEPADARACSKGTARYLQARGVVAPWALGCREAEAMRRRLWWRGRQDRGTAKERLSLPELRLLLGLNRQPADIGAYIEQVDSVDSYSFRCDLVDAQHTGRGEFSRRLASKEPTTLLVWPEEPDDSIDFEHLGSAPVPPVAASDRRAYRPARARPADDPRPVRGDRGLFPAGGGRAAGAWDQLGGTRGGQRQVAAVFAGDAARGCTAAVAAGVPRAGSESPPADPRLRLPDIAP